MKILSYNLKTGILAINYNTKNIWEYSLVDEDTFYKIQGARKSEKQVKDILRKANIVGENKGVM